MEQFSRLDQGHYRQDINTRLQNRFSHFVIDYLDWPIKFLFADYLYMEGHFQNSDPGLNDYSLVVAPAYKGFEGFMYQLGEDLGLFKSSDSPSNMSSFFEEKKIDKAIKDVLDKVLDLSNNVDKNKAKDIIGRVSELRNLLKRYRHTPAHYQGDKCIPSFSKARDYVSSIFFNMNDICLLLNQTGLLNKPEQLKGV